MAYIDTLNRNFDKGMKRKNLHSDTECKLNNLHEVISDEYLEPGTRVIVDCRHNMARDELEFGIIGSRTKCTVNVLIYPATGWLIYNNNDIMRYKVKPDWNARVTDTYKIRMNKKGEYWYKLSDPRNSKAMSARQPLCYFNPRSEYIFTRYKEDKGRYKHFHPTYFCCDKT